MPAPLSGPKAHALDITCTLEHLPFGPGLLYHRSFPKGTLKPQGHLRVYFRNKSKLFPTASGRSPCISCHSQLFSPSRVCLFPWPRSADPAQGHGPAAHSEAPLVHSSWDIRVCNDNRHFILKLLDTLLSLLTLQHRISIWEIGIGQLLNNPHDMGHNSIPSLWAEGAAGGILLPLHFTVGSTEKGPRHCLLSEVKEAWNCFPTKPSLVHVPPALSSKWPRHWRLL